MYLRRDEIFTLYPLTSRQLYNKMHTHVHRDIDNNDIRTEAGWNDGQFIQINKRLFNRLKTSSSSSAK